MTSPSPKPADIAAQQGGTKSFSLIPCGHCGLQFQPVPWLPHRVRGYCSKKCFEIRHPVTA